MSNDSSQSAAALEHDERDALTSRWTLFSGSAVAVAQPGEVRRWRPRPVAADWLAEAERSAARVPAMEVVAVPGKRLLDVVLVLLAVPVWLPLLFLVAAATAFFSGFPIFYTQTRMGRGGRPFRIYKIRTMTHGAAAPAAAVFGGWTYPSDPRVTPLGRRLRQYRLDELPQLWNVLRGDMSLVGPRPEVWDVAVSLGDRIPGYHNRHRVLPGLTGLCQVSRFYMAFGTVEKLTRRLRLDHYYVNAWSLRMDLVILWRTIAVIVRGAGVA